MAARSNTSIANRALQKLGARRIDSLAEDSPNARSVAAAFDEIRDRLLRDHPWNFAIKRANVAADTTETIWGGLNRFRQPDDFLRLLRGREAGTDSMEARNHWQIEGQHIVTDVAAPLEFRYVAKIVDPMMFDSLFAELFSLTLASEIADDITQTSSRVERVIQEREMLEEKAKKVNAMENPSQEPPEDDWLAAMR